MDEGKQLAKDLALAYATVKLQDAITTGFLKSTLAPPHVEEMEYLLGEFQTAFEYYHLACGVQLTYEDEQEH